MKVLIICSKNSGRIAPFIIEQVEALNELGVITKYFTVEQKGVVGYLGSRKLMLQKIKSFQPDLIHAHYGMSGLLANLQRRVPVVVTYHGSDINNNKAFLFSCLSILLSKFNIFVSQKNIDKSNVKKNFSLIPCGVDLVTYKLKNQVKAREALSLDNQKKYALFSGSFSNHIKNSSLAIQSVKLLEDLQLIELVNRSREEVVLLMSAVDICLMTSLNEGSPQFIKEAMACNCPIVSVDVGDVAEVIGDTQRCYISSYDVKDFAENLQKALKFGQRTKGRDRITKLGLDSQSVAKKILDVYKSILD